MNQKFNIISIILMALLVILLFFVMINYYFKTDTTSSESPLNMSGTDVIITSGDSEAIMSNYVGKTVSGEKTPIISSNSGEEENSGDGVIDVIYNEEKNPDSVVNVPQKDGQVIITSNENISDKEKKEVLQELDQTLMDLLDIVDKVQIVDESRLEEGIEVQP